MAIVKLCWAQDKNARLDFTQICKRLGEAGGGGGGSAEAELAPLLDHKIGEPQLPPQEGAPAEGASAEERVAWLEAVLRGKDLEMLQLRHERDAERTENVRLRSENARLQSQLKGNSSEPADPTSAQSLQMTIRGIRTRRREEEEVASTGTGSSTVSSASSGVTTSATTEMFNTIKDLSLIHI